MTQRRSIINKGVSPLHPSTFNRSRTKHLLSLRNNETMNDVIKMVLWDGQREDESNGERERGRRQTN